MCTDTESFHLHVHVHTNDVHCIIKVNSNTYHQNPNGTNNEIDISKYNRSKTQTDLTSNPGSQRSQFAEHYHDIIDIYYTQFDFFHLVVSMHSVYL